MTATALKILGIHQGFLRFWPCICLLLVKNSSISLFSDTLYFKFSFTCFFTTIQNSWIVTKKEIYIEGMYDGETEQSYTAYKISSKSNEYILKLLSENGIV